ncbi:hypothetical protein AYK24_01000 [Thermoplasmatales archaeon SG8-52-4]|nr:MAG: hypothetical protein AYK24_01000 [Thermoplasmatales archaeon SG8-52-4]
MRTEIIWKFLVASVILLFGVIIIVSTMLTYPLNLNSVITEYYLESLHLTGSINVVTAILLDFRIYDTLGEILVIFVTISGIMMLIWRKNDLKNC